MVLVEAAQVSAALEPPVAQAVLVASVVQEVEGVLEEVGEGRVDFVEILAHTHDLTCLQIVNVLEMLRV